MKRAIGTVVVGVVVVTSCLVPALLRAQTPRTASPAPPPGAELKTGWHIVRPGETLRGIADRYAGSSELWKRLHELNPGIANPDLIEPGQRIEILLKPNESIPSGQLRKLSRRVEEQPAPIPWLDAQRGDILVDHDAVRTSASSSAEIEFTDGARLTLTEDSLIFLHSSGGALRAGPKKAVEIVQGQADFESRGVKSASPYAEVELIVGAARATTGLDDKGVAQTRARRADGGAAKLMVYGGKGEVAAGGAKVDVPAGMGTSVESQGPPSPPEKLLAAPVLAAPESGGQRACANPVFTWQPTTGASAYVLELCKDAPCAELIVRRTDLTAPTWKADALAVGDLYWRVTARSASGLDGYPSATQRLTVLAPRASLPAPEGVLRVSGASLRVGERLVVAPGTQVGVAVTDATAQWSPAADGKAVDALPTTWTPGEHTVATASIDGCGNRVAGAALPFTVDGAAPQVRWKLGSRKDFESQGVLAPDDEGKRRRAKGSDSGRPAKGFWPSVAGVWEVPLPWSKAERRSRPQPLLSTEPLVIESDHPQAFLRLPDSRLTVDGKDESAQKDADILWITAADDIAGVERLILREQVEGNRVVLTVETLDAVGNRTVKELVVRGLGSQPGR